MPTLREMLTNLSKASVEKGGYVEYGYGQVEPNHLSAQRTAQIYAQLPAAAEIKVLEQGQFVKYDYANGVCDFVVAADEEKGIVANDALEWMLVYNETKLYRDGQIDCEFAMKKDDYNARIYSPYDAAIGENTDAQSRYYNGQIETPEGSHIIDNHDGTISITNEDDEVVAGPFPIDDVTAAPDMYELFATEDPFHIQSKYKAARMPKGTTMVPRVFKTNVGDIFTTNMVKETTLKVGDILAPGATDGILAKDSTQAMKWQVVKVYNLADRQKAVKVMRIA